jgi:heme/copper-type cytochrome/quinol oxidase subunit 4
MTATTPEQAADDRLKATVMGFAVVAALTAAELGVVGLDVGRAARVTALCGLLLAKVGLVLKLFLRVGARRRDPRFALGALFLASGFAVVLMLEMAFRMRQR